MKNIKNVFISDVHIGGKFSKTDSLNEFLKVLKGEDHLENIYLVGDIIDGWKLKKNFFWKTEENKFIRKILKFSKRGINIYWSVGNHDDFLKEYLHEHGTINIGNIEVGFNFYHHSVNGDKLLVTHGDIFDSMIKNATWLCRLGDSAYDWLIRLNYIYNFIMGRFGVRYWSLSKYIKSKVKQASIYISNYEHLLVKHAEINNCDGVICGHIHTPEIKMISSKMYYNSGDWVENCTALIEFTDGTFEIYHHF